MHTAATIKIEITPSEITMEFLFVRREIHDIWKVQYFQKSQRVSTMIPS